MAAARALLAGGADVSIRCDECERPVIFIATEKEHVEILRAAIEHGADVGAVDTRKYTALHLAAAFNRAEAVDVLVEAGASTEAQSSVGSTPLHEVYFEARLSSCVF